MQDGWDVKQVVVSTFTNKSPLLQNSGLTKLLKGYIANGGGVYELSF